MSETMTRSLRKAAVPQEPMSGPIINGLIARVQSLGTRGPAAGHSRWPSGSISRTEEMMPGL